MSQTLVLDTASGSNADGLTASQAAEILRRDGPNELPQEQRRGPFRIILEAVREPMLQLLLGAGLIYLVIGDLAEALDSACFRNAECRPCRCAGKPHRTSLGRPEGNDQSQGVGRP